MTSNNENIRFGLLALKKGYVTERQLGMAVSLQMKEDIEQAPHRYLGEIMLDMGLLNNTEIEDLLLSLNNQRTKETSMT